MTPKDLFSIIKLPLFHLFENLFLLLELRILTGRVGEGWQLHSSICSFYLYVYCNNKKRKGLFVFRGTGCSNRRCWREWWLCLFVNEGKWSFEYSSKKYYVRISPFSLYPSVSFCSPNPGVWACCSLSQLSQAGYTLTRTATGQENKEL